MPCQSILIYLIKKNVRTQGQMTNLTVSNFRWLKSRGVKPQRIQQLLAGGHIGNTGRFEGGEAEIPHYDEGTWLLKDCSRTDAERLLMGKKDGTFLVRPSSQGGNYALSIM